MFTLNKVTVSPVSIEHTVTASSETALIAGCYYYKYRSQPALGLNCKSTTA